MAHTLMRLIMAAVGVASIIATGGSSAHSADFGTTGAAFLEAGVGSRALAMGSAGVALVRDGSALYWNPAGLCHMDGRRVSVMHEARFEGLSHDFVAYTPYLGERISVGLSVVGLFATDLERRSGPSQEAEGTFGAYDACPGISFAIVLSDDLAIGWTGKAILQQIDGNTAQGGAFDVGLQWFPGPRGLAVGLAARNLGPGISMDETEFALPMTFVLGLGWQPSFIGMNLALDIGQGGDGTPIFNCGSEFRPLHSLALRGGYGWRSESLDHQTPAGLSTGVGLDLDWVEFDYAFLPNTRLGDSHVLTASLAVGQRSWKRPISSSPREPFAPGLGGTRTTEVTLSSQGGVGTAAVWDARSIAGGLAGVGCWGHYNRPFLVGQSSGDDWDSPGVTRGDLALTVGLDDLTELSVDFPLHLDWHRTDRRGATYLDAASAGSVVFALKRTVLDIGDRWFTAMAIRPFWSVGNGRRLTDFRGSYSDAASDIGLHGLVSMGCPKGSLHLNGGYMKAGCAEDLDRENEFLYSAAVAIPVGTRVGISAELVGRALHDFSVNPLGDFLSVGPGITYCPVPEWGLSFGIEIGLGDRSPGWRAKAGMSFLFALAGAEGM